MLIERSITIYDDDDFEIKAVPFSSKEVKIVIPQLDVELYCSYDKLRELFRSAVKAIKRAEPKPKEGICKAKATMSDKELLKALGWGV